MIRIYYDHTVDGDSVFHLTQALGGGREPLDPLEPSNEGCENESMRQRNLSSMEGPARKLSKCERGTRQQSAGWTEASVFENSAQEIFFSHSELENPARKRALTN